MVVAITCEVLKAMVMRSLQHVPQLHISADNKKSAAAAANLTSEVYARLLSRSKGQHANAAAVSRSRIRKGEHMCGSSNQRNPEIR